MHQALAAWGDAVYRLALAQLCNTADAQDVTQDVFIRLLQSTVCFQSDEHLKAWLLRVTINRCRDLQRTVWHARVDEFADGPQEELARQHAAERVAGAEPTPEDAAIAALEAHPVWQALAQLPEDQRTVMHLRYVEQLNADEIAELTGAQPATVRTRLHRARVKLLAILQEDEGAPAAPPHTPAHLKPAAAPFAPHAPDLPR